MSYRSGGTVRGPLRFTGTASPGVSSAGEGRIYFDSGSNVFKVSENGGAYVNLVGGGGGSSGWTDDGTVVRLTDINDQVGIGNATPDPTAKVEIDASAGGFVIGLTVRSGYLTAPSGGLASEAFGFGATANGADSTSVGNSSDDGGFQGCTVVGKSSVAANDFATIVGSNSTGAFNSVTVGVSSAVGSNGVSVGSNIVNSGANSTVIGQGAQSLGDGCVVIGPSAQGGTSGQTNVIVVGGSQADGTDIVVMGSASVTGSNLVSVGTAIDAIFGSNAASTKVVAIGGQAFGSVAGRQFVLIGDRGNEGLQGDNIYAMGHWVGAEDTIFMSQILLGAGAIPLDQPLTFIAGSNMQPATDVWFGAGASANGAVATTIHGTRADTTVSMFAPVTPSVTLDPTAGGWAAGTYNFFATRFDGVGESAGSALGSFTITGSEAPIFDNFDPGDGANRACGMYVYIEDAPGSGVYRQAKPQTGVSNRYLVSGLGPELYNTQPTTEPTRDPSDPSYTRTGVGGAINLAGGYGVDAANTGGNIGFYTARTGTADTLTLAGYFNADDGTFSVPGAGGQSERFGLGAKADGTDSVAIGFNCHSDTLESVVIGSTADADQPNVVIIGYAAYAGTTAAGSVAVGSGASSHNDSSIVIGRGAEASVAFAPVTLIGTGATNVDANGTAQGRVFVGAGPQSHKINDVYFGSGISDSTGTNAAESYTIHGTGGNVNFPNGANVSLAGGIGYTATDQGGEIHLQTAIDGAATTLVDALLIDRNANLVQGTGALLTTATDGFLHIETCAGTPTGVPTNYAGRAPIIYDSTNNYLYVYNTAWQGVPLASGGGVFTSSQSNVYDDGLGPIDHLVGPTDQFLRIVSPDSSAPTGVIVYGGDATTGNANGGAVGLQGGDGDGTGFGGVVTVSGGAATSATGFGGSVSILGGPASLGNQAGQVNITGGTVGGSGQSGSVVISTPNGSGAAGRSGAIQLTCGNNSTTNSQSGLGVTIASGKGGGAGGLGGGVSITGGQGGDTSIAGDGGAVSITAGNAGTVATFSATGGSVLISAGGGTGSTGNGGDVTLTPGPAAGGGTNGAIKFNGRAQGQLGSAVASANDIALTYGNLFSVTGTTTINTISATGWRAGSVVTLLFTSTPTVADNAAGAGASILLNGSTNFAVTAGSTLTLVYDGSTWTEIARMTR